MLIYIIIIIIAIILWYNKYIIQFIINSLIYLPYPHDLHIQILLNGLATTLKKYTLEQGGYTTVRVPLEINYDIITSNKIPIEQVDIFKKKNSVPQFIMEIALITAKGTSIFLENYEDRGVDNHNKAEYMSALTFEQLELYKIIIREVLKRNNLSIFNKIMIITWLLHFGNEPDNQDIEYMILFCKSLSNSASLF
jgi:hypothetical protein